jgi:hypothetical protein
MIYTKFEKGRKEEQASATTKTKRKIKIKTKILSLQSLKKESKFKESTHIPLVHNIPRKLHKNGFLNH